MKPSPTAQASDAPCEPARIDPLLDTVPCCFFSFTDDGNLVAANETLRVLLGYGAGELEHQHVSSLLGPGGRIFFHTHLFPLLKLHGTVEEIFLSFRTAARAEIPVLVNGIRRERDGRHVSDCIAVRILQRSRWEGEVVRARTLAEQAQRDEAKKSAELALAKAQLEQALEELNSSFWHLRKLAEVLPICMDCRRIRTHEEQWEEVAEYFRNNSLLVSHGCCPECEQKWMNSLDMSEELDGPEALKSPSAQ